MTKPAAKPFGRCQVCHYKRSSVNHRVLCIRNIRTTRPAAEIARLAALATWGDTAAEQWQRREELRIGADIHSSKDLSYTQAAAALQELR